MISFRIILALFLLKLRNQFGMAFMTNSSKFLANIRDIYYKETNLHVEKNYKQLSGFGFNKTILLYRGNDKHQHLLPINSYSTPKIISQFFITSLSEFFQYSPFYCRLMVMVTTFSLKRARLNEIIIQGVFICLKNTQKYNKNKTASF